MIGIGGSYLGARAAIEFLKSPFYNNLKKDTPDIYYVGQQHQPHLPERSDLDLRGQRFLCQRHFQVRHDHRAGSGIPCVPSSW